MPTLAEERAARDGLPVILFTNAEAINVLAGTSLIMGIVNGGQALVRLHSVDELLEAVEQAGVRLEAAGCPPGPGITRAKAEELVRPLDMQQVTAAMRRANDDCDKARARVVELEEQIRGMVARDRAATEADAALRELAQWLISMDDLEQPAGLEARRTVTLTRIIDRARQALGEG